MDTTRIKKELNTKLIGKRIYFYKEIGSTNDEAKRLIGMGVGEGAVIAAETQTDGRGKLARKWFSPKGQGLYLSTIIQPFRTSDKTLPITLLGSLASARAINCLTGLEVKVKWPNDIMISGKKVGGVLSEACNSKRGRPAVVVGIGINVSVPKKEFPDEIKDTATSILNEFGRKVSRTKLMKLLLEELEKLYFLMLANRSDMILAEWKILSDTLGRHLKIMTQHGIEAGHAIDVGKRGELILKTDDGRIKKFFTGDILK